MIRTTLPFGLSCVLMAACGVLLEVEADAPPNVDGGAVDGNGAGDDGGSSSGDGAPTHNVPFAPSHIAPASARLDGPTLADVVDIDTSAFQLKKSDETNGVAVPYFFGDSQTGAAVLVVSTWNVNVDVSVHGDKSLVVVAAADVLIDAKINASAKGTTPGPGGRLPGVGYAGAGVGHDGTLVGDKKGGGGGAGFGTVGAPGQSVTSVLGGDGGTPFGANLADFFGGAGGGKGPGLTNCPQGKLGGAGGGVVQISARGAINVGANGGINVGGGGGEGGCFGGSAGGGGGSGGTILLEAATAISVAGVLAANGGGGGSGGGPASGGGGNGNGGKDGQLSAIPAPGGADEGTCTPCAGGAGGAGSVAPAQPSGSANSNGAGGGGAVGRIWLHTRKVTPVTTSTISPAAQTDTTF